MIRNALISNSLVPSVIPRMVPAGAPPGTLLTHYTDTFERGDGALGSPWQGTNWAIVSGRAVGTPAAGPAELLTDGGLENWTTPTDLTSWSESIAGASTVNREAVITHGGSFAARLDIDAANSNAMIYQVPTVTAGVWYLTTVWIRSDAGAPSVLIRHVDGASVARTLSTAYAQYAQSGRAAGGGYVQLQRNSATSRLLYLDDVSLMALSQPTLFAGVQFDQNNMDVSAPLTRTMGCQSGVVLNLDSVTSPLNCVVAYVDGAGNVKLDKLVNGTWSSVATVAVTYGADKILRCKQASSTSFSFYYDGAQLGATQTISDMSIVNNRICGLFSTYSGNSFASFSAVPS